MFFDSETMTDEQYDAQFDLAEQNAEPTDAELEEMFQAWLAEQDAAHVLTPEPW